MSLSRIRRVALGAIATSAIAVGVVGVVPAAAVPIVTFNVTVHRSCAYLTGPATLPVTVSQLTSGGSVVEKATSQFDLSGNTFVCFDDNFDPGMKVSALTNGMTRTVTIPKMSVKINRVTDVISGVGPASKKLEVSIVHYSTFKAYKTTVINKTVSSSGTWSMDTTSAVNLIGGDRIGVMYRASAGDNFDLDGTVPFVGVRIASSRVIGSVNAGSTVTVSLKTPTGATRARAHLASAYSAQALDSVFMNTSGYGVTARIGDKISSTVATNGTFTISNLTVNVDTGTNVVSGSCLASKPMKIEVTTPQPYTFTRTFTSCNSAGHYSLDTTSSVDIAPGDRVVATVRTSSGDTIERLRTAP